MAVIGIPDSTLKPGFYADTDWSAGSPALPGNQETCLIIAPMSASGTATVGKIVSVYTSEVDDQFGAGSTATKMVKASLNAYSMLNLSVLPVASNETSIEDALTAAFSAGHSMIATSFIDETNLLLLRDYLDEVSSALEQRTALAFIAHTGEMADVITLAGKLNSGRIQLPYLRGTSTTAAELAATYMAVAASEEDPAMPLNTLELKGVSLPDEEDYLSRLEQESLLHAGVTPLEVTIDKRVQIVRAITTYTKNATGAEDVSQLDITKIRTADYMRRAIRNYLALRFPRVKYSARIAKAVKAAIIAVLYEAEAAELIINVAANLQGLVITEGASGRVNATIPTTIIEGLHVFYAELQIVV